MLDALQAKVREFARESGVWRDRLPKLDVYKGLADYQLDIPYNAELVALHQLYWGDRALRFRAINQVRATDQSNEPDYWTMPELNVVRIDPAPDADLTDQLEPYAALTLARGESACPDELMQFAEGIGYGAAARLKMMPGMPWTDREGMPAYEREFKSTIGDAKKLAMTSMSGVSGRSREIGFHPP